MAQNMGLDPNGLAYLTLSSSLIGGTTAELTGGSFEQGAQMAVTQAVFNRFLTNVYEQGGNLIEETIYVRDNDPNEACYGYKNGQIMSREVVYESGLQDDYITEILATGAADVIWSSGRALTGAIMSRAGAKGLIGNPMYRSALQSFKGGPLTNAGRALTKHPEVLGFSKQTIRQTLKTNSQLNQAAHSALKNIMRNGVRTTPNLPRYGNVVQYQLKGGFGARFRASDSSFIGFINP